MQTHRTSTQHTQIPRKSLRGLEKPLVRFHERLNQSPRGQRGIAFWQKHMAGPFVRWLTQARWDLHGLDRVKAIPAQRGTILVSNHRSFFDMFVTLTVLFVEHGMYRNLFFPVRAPFFYTHPLGPVVSGFFSGFSMWPPVFRDERKTFLNPIGVRQVLEVLDQPGSCIGLHPEGQRNVDENPYSLLSAKAGVGHMVRETHPETLIVPVFISGLNNDFLDQVLMRVLPSRRKEATPIRWVFGEPLRAGDLCEKGDAQAIADYLLHEEIFNLAEEARARDGGQPTRRATAAG